MDDFIEICEGLLHCVGIAAQQEVAKSRQPQSKGKRSKQKGKRGENEAAKFFGNLLFNDPKAYVKSPGSGAGVFRGDITPNPEKNYNFLQYNLNVEVKNDERFSLDIFLSKAQFEKSFIAKTIDQVLRDVKNTEAIPIIYMTKNYRDALIILPFEKCINDPEEASFQITFQYKDNIWTALKAIEIQEKYGKSLFIAWREA